MDFELLASQLLRVQRGRKSRIAWSRRLGFHSNVAYAWESRHAFPSAAQALENFARQGADLRSVYARFHQREPSWLGTLEPASPAAVASFLDNLRGRTPVRELAAHCGASRFAVARWLSGETTVRLPDFLRVIQAASLRVLDFVALLADPARLPSVAKTWSKLESSRKLAYEMPWTQAVLRGLELASYRALPKHRAGWLAKRLGISQSMETMCLDVLVETGQTRLRNGHYEVVESLMIDTRRDQAAAWRAREFWTRASLECLSAKRAGTYWYNVFGISDKDLQRVQELQARHFRELRAIIAQSEPVERVVLTVQHLVPLDGHGGSDAPEADKVAPGP